MLQLKLVEVYGNIASTDKWFRSFNNDDCSFEDKYRSGQPKEFEKKALKALLDEDHSQTQGELSESFGVS